MENSKRYCCIILLCITIFSLNSCVVALRGDGRGHDNGYHNGGGNGHHDNGRHGH